MDRNKNHAISALFIFNKIDDFYLQPSCFRVFARARSFITYKIDD